MVDLTSEMAQLKASLAPILGVQSPVRASIVQFISARSDEGCSTAAREFARLCALSAKKPVWLVDLDLPSSSQYDAIAADPGRYGAPGAPAQASPDGSMFFAVQPPVRAGDGRPAPDHRYVTAHPVGQLRLWVTRFRRERLKPGQWAQAVSGSGYWNALRRHAEIIVIDTPAADRSGAGLTVCAEADAVVMVVAADMADARGPAGLKAAIAGAGGKVAGVFLNRTEQPPAPGFLARVGVGRR